MNTELNIPNHVAIILDGNRRWAKKRGMKPQEAIIRIARKLSNIIFSVLKSNHKYECH